MDSLRRHGEAKQSEPVCKCPEAGGGAKSSGRRGGRRAPAKTPISIPTDAALKQIYIMCIRLCLPARRELLRRWVGRFVYLRRLIFSRGEDISRGRRERDAGSSRLGARAMYRWQALEVVGALRCGVGWQKCHFVECLWG